MAFFSTAIAALILLSSCIYYLTKIYSWEQGQEGQPCAALLPPTPASHPHLSKETAIRQKNWSLARESSAIYSTPIRDLFTTSMRPNGSSGSTMRLRDSIASIFIDFARFLYDFSEQVLYKYIRTNGRIARTTTIDGATDETVYIYRYIEMLLLYKKQPRLVLSSRISFFSSFSYTSPLLLLQWADRVENEAKWAVHDASLRLDQFSSIFCQFP